MGRYIIRRLLQFVPTVLGTMLLLHYITSLAIQFSGNPVRALFGDRTPPPALVTALNERLGYDNPCLTQRGNPCFGLFLDRLQQIFLHFDFGINLRERPVTELVADAVPFTVKIVIIAIIFEAIVGIAAGVLAGLRGGSFWDYLVKISTVFVISVPIFVLGIVVREYVGVKFGNMLRDMDWVPDLISRGVFSAGFKVEYPWASLVIPGLVLGATSLATTARLTRTSIMENIRSDYVRTAKAKGVAGKDIVLRHVFRNSLLPVITMFATIFPAMLAGSVVIEKIFTIPGMGNLILDGIHLRDRELVLANALMIGTVNLLALLLADILYAVADPRITYD